ncbi:putative cyanate lyase [Ascodesmis nigricans]|uniref:Cyanate hydratase n=1 Tax=Ascodesmis nigricans TaxID=341454 RepID=A0A4V3SIM0_9PEZI|nr:putative cyanate lyase [Ascodesmis nigricans]
MAHIDSLTQTLLTAKSTTTHTFASLSTLLGRDEVAIAALFYGAALPSESDLQHLSTALRIPYDELKSGFEKRGFPCRGVGMEMPPKEPLVYRLYEIVMNYGWAYKAVLNEMFGDGIVSAIAFSTNVKKEVEDDGSEWAVITLRGKWLPYKRF